jgi:hypothetical protein
MPPTPTISFNCQQCGKKFTAPASAAGRTVPCKCGAQVTISAAPTSQSFAVPTSSNQPAAASSSSTGPAHHSTFQPPASTSSTGYASQGLAPSRRKFSALDAVARSFTALAWFNVIFAFIGALALLIAANQNPGPETLGAAIGGSFGLAILAGLAFTFFRALAESIRLGLYIAELLEDIRAK